MTNSSPALLTRADLALMLSYAVASGDITRIDAWISAGADIHGFHHGNTLLHVPIRRGDLAVVQHLVELGIPIDRPNFSGQRPLHLALYDKNEEMVKLLLQLGARLDLPGVRDQNALIVAAGEIGPEVPRILRLLVQHGAELDATDDRGITALHHAVQTGSLNNAICLLELGADHHLKDCEGRTPLDMTHPDSELYSHLLGYIHSHQVLQTISQVAKLPNESDLCSL